MTELISIPDFEFDVQGNPLKYRDNSKLKLQGTVLPYTKAHIKEMARCAKDINYFINNYYKLVHQDHGLIQATFRDYQNKAIENFLDYRFNVLKWPRQSGKSTCFEAYVCWFILFHQHKRVGILANKDEQSKELLSRIKLAYQNLPFWLQQGVKSWNKKSIELENGCSIIASSTSGDSLRGKACSLLIVDEVAFIPPNMWDEFWQSVYPTISSAKTSRVILVSCVTKDTIIFTEDGIKEVSDFIELDEEKGYEVEKYGIEGKDGIKNGNIMYNNGTAETKIFKTTSSEIESSLEHKFWACKEGTFGWYKAKELNGGDYLSIKYGMELWGNDDTLIPNNKVYSYKNKNIYKFNLITPDLAYFLGMFIAEGYAKKLISENGNTRGGSLVLTCGDDIGFVFDDLGIKYKKYDEWHYSVSSLSLIEFIESLGFDLTKKAPKKIIPKRLLSISRENIIALLQGIFDGDGYSRKDKGTIGISLSSPKLIKQIRMLLINFGILTDYTTGITKPTKKVKVESKYYRLTLNNKNSEIFYEKIGFRFVRKQNNRLVESHLNHINSKRVGNQDDIIPFSKLKMRELKEKLSEFSFIKFNGEAKKLKHYSREKMLRIKDKITPNDYFEDNVNENIKWEKIKSIDYSTNEVYDFSLDEIENDKWCHSVIYNGILGHQTPKGMNHYYKMWKQAVKGQSEFVPLEITYQEVPGYDAAWEKTTRRNIGDRKFSQEYDCNFLASSNSLINVEILEGVEDLEPIELREVPIYHPIMRHNEYFEDFVKIYREPVEGHIYSMGVDSAKITEESQGDSLAVQITDVTNWPYENVFTTIIPDKIHYLEIPYFLDVVGRWYNEAMMYIENNDSVGQEIADTLLLDYDYENIYSEKPGISGFRTTKRNKKIGCLNLKMVMENYQMEIYDTDTVSQLSTFIKNGNSYEAEKGYMDDAVMSLIASLQFMQDRVYFEDKMGLLMKLNVKKHVDARTEKLMSGSDRSSEDYDPLPMASSNENLEDMTIF